MLALHIYLVIYDLLQCFCQLCPIIFLSMYVKSYKSPILSVQSLSKAFDGKHILKNISFELFSNENLIVMGKSGVGKSILIKCIIGLVRADSFRINFNGVDIQSFTKNDFSFLRSHFGFLFQSGALYDSMTVRANLEFPLRRKEVKLTNKEIGLLIDEALDDVGLRHTAELMPQDLSGGMRKRIGLARTLIAKPQVMLYDEPTTGLDIVTSREIVNLINDVKDKYGTSAIIITHDSDCIKRNSDRILLLYDGHIYAEGTYSAMLSHSDPIVKQFFYN